MNTFERLTNPKIAGSVIFLVITAILAAFGLLDSSPDLAYGGLAFAGIGHVNLTDISDMLEKQGETFQDFKTKNDQKLKSLEKDLIEVMKKSNRIGQGAGSLSGDLHESKQDLAALFRSRGEVKGMFSGSGPAGGWTVAPVLQEGIGTIIRQNNALRQLVDFIEIEAGDSYVELIPTSVAGATWVGEQSSRPETTSPELAKIDTPLLEIYANPVLSQRLADDSGTAMVDWLVNEVAISFAESEEAALFVGDGVIQPMGLDNVSTSATADATRTFGVIEHIATGASGAFDSNDPMDAIIKVFYQLRAGYRSDAVWVMSSATALAVSKMQDGQGNYLWQQGDVASGQPVTLLGKPVVICESCPAIAADSKSIWFGSWRQALRAIERPGYKVLVDPYSSKPHLQVYVYRRMGLALRNSNALKCLKFAAA